jgi:hypothetical protein
MHSPYCGQYQAVSFDDLHRASRRIRNAMPQAISIDNFLDAHSEDKAIELCGKLAITRTILKAEQTSNLFVDPRQGSTMRFYDFKDTWFNPFFQCINEGCSTRTLEKRLSSIVLIIFNYDRCIEHYIYHSLQNYYAISENDAAELLKGIEIYHPYGMVGSLPYIRPDGATDFGAAPHPTNLINLAKQIKTFTEGTDEGSSDICDIRERMKQAKRLVFVGFAFHPMNIELLIPRSESREPFESQVYATGYGLSLSDREVIVKDLVARGMRELNVELTPDTCTRFFSDYRRSLSFT